MLDKPHRPTVYAHRGSSLYAPENTKGVDGILTDDPPLARQALINLAES